MLVDTPGRGRGKRGVIEIKETGALVDLHDDGVPGLEVLVVAFIKNREPT